MAEEISNKKWRGLAKRVAPLVNVKDLTPNNIYSSFKEICKGQRDYFGELFKTDRMGYVKTSYYIYSLLKTGKFELGDNIINNLFFASILETDNETYYDTCNNCAGDGYESCDECDSNGNVTCSECDGEGEVGCWECDGDGKISCDDCDGTGEDEEGNNCSGCGGSGEVTCGDCEGKGEKTCGNCNGDGEESCGECGGDGSKTCDTCYGRGEEVTDAINYVTYDICTSNKDIFNLCELNVNTEKPITTDDTYGDFWKEIINLGRKEKHGEQDFELETEQVYCYYFTTEPRLYMKADFSLGLYEEDEYFYFNT